MLFCPKMDDIIIEGEISMNLTPRDLDWKVLLIKKYQSYGLDETDCMVLFVAEAALDLQPKTLLTADILSPYMRCGKDKIDQSLSKLMDKKYLVYKQEGTSFYPSFDEFKLRLFNDEIKDLTLKGNNSSSANLLSQNLYSALEEMNGPLSPLEKDRVASWLRNGAEESMIKEACEKSRTKNGHISFKTADTLILQMERSSSRKNIGVSLVNEDTESKEELSKLIDDMDWGFHSDN